MCRLVETIKIVNGKACDLAYHVARAERSRKELFGNGKSLDIESALWNHQLPESGVYKCRVLYREEIEEIQMHPYTPREVKTLCLVESDTIDYAHKYEDKSMFNALLSKKGSCDDIIIVKNGNLTDTSFSNLALFDGKSWWTPSTFLLRGTMREKLLCEGLIHETAIGVKDLTRFEKVSLINTMLELGDAIVSVENIAW